jgi:hypothetical protein
MGFVECHPQELKFYIEHQEEKSLAFFKFTLLQCCTGCKEVTKIDSGRMKLCIEMKWK